MSVFFRSLLELDTFEGAAWIGLVPFEIYGTPGLPYFPETNVRTYVVGPGGKPLRINLVTPKA